MARNFKELEARMSPERIARSNARVRKMLAEMPLNELREARELTQDSLADILGINQAAVSKLENRMDMYLSTLRRFVEAMGGQLVISAHFPDGEVRIKQFSLGQDEERAVGATR
jgi:DNA-binding XRE family transcriptional regulator